MFARRYFPALWVLTRRFQVFAANGAQAVSTQSIPLRPPISVKAHGYRLTGAASPLPIGLDSFLTRPLPSRFEFCRNVASRAEVHFDWRLPLGARVD